MKMLHAMGIQEQPRHQQLQFLKFEGSISSKIGFSKELCLKSEKGFQQSHIFSRSSSYFMISIASFCQAMLPVLTTSGVFRFRRSSSVSRQSPALITQNISKPRRGPIPEMSSHGVRQRPQSSDTESSPRFNSTSSTVKVIQLFF